MPEYSYQCLKCGSITKLVRPMAEVYDSLSCLNCSEDLDGEKSKILDRGVSAYHVGGSSKGRMNNCGGL
jgi:putative FmdB family regulatory protein